MQHIGQGGYCNYVNNCLQMGYNSYPTSKGEGKESVMFKFQAEES